VPAAIASLSELRGRTDESTAVPGPEAFFDLFGLGEWIELGQRYDGGS
jgi:hypothetical protein